MTASGNRLNREKGEQQRQLRQQWQPRAFYFFDELGVIKFASGFYSRPLSKLRLFAAERDDEGEITETTNEQVIAQVDRIKDAGGSGRRQLLYTYGQLMFLVGESLLFCSRPDPEGEEQWEFLSTDELRVEPGNPTRYMRLKAPSLAMETYQEAPEERDYEEVQDNDAIAYRIWHPHPRFTSLADAPMRGVLDICEELVILTRSIRATARSRIANRGILLVPEGIGPKPLEVAGDENADEDPFLRDLIEAATTAIVDESSASAVAPIVVRGDPDALDRVRHLSLVEPTMLYPETAVRTELIHRLALELDMPPEALLGNQDSNHWNAWMVDEQSWKDHQEPVAQRLCNDLTASFLIPTLTTEGVEDPERYLIWYDPADVVVHPDKSKDAKDLYAQAAISPASLREATGFTDDDAPTEEEALRQIGITVRDSSLAAFGIPGRIPGGVLEPAAGELERANPGQVIDSSNVSQTPPAEPDVAARQSGNGNGTQPPVAASAMVGAAHVVMHRAREKAGARLVSLAKRDDELAKMLEGVPLTKVAAALGPEGIARLRAPEPRELVAGSADLLEVCLAQWGIRDEKAAEFLGDQIEHHAARTLFETDPMPLPAAFANYIIALQTTEARPARAG